MPVNRFLLQISLLQSVIQYVEHLLIRLNSQLMEAQLIQVLMQQFLLLLREVELWLLSLQI